MYCYPFAVPRRLGNVPVCVCVCSVLCYLGKLVEYDQCWWAAQIIYIVGRLLLDWMVYVSGVWRSQIIIYIYIYIKNIARYL
jgi:hypothetical protein